MILHEDRSNGKVGVVGVDVVSESVNGENEYRGGGEGGLELIHDWLMSVGPYESTPSLKRLVRGAQNRGMILIETPLVVGRAEEAP